MSEGCTRTNCNGSYDTTAVVDGVTFQRCHACHHERSYRTVREQPAPIANTHRAVWDAVIEDMRARDLIGRARYGVRLQPHNGRDALLDAYEEALDLAAYLKQALMERDATQPTTTERGGDT